MAAADAKEWAEEIRQGFEKPVQGPPDDFGKRLKKAVQQRKPTASYSRIQAGASAGESFGSESNALWNDAPTARNNISNEWRLRNSVITDRNNDRTLRATKGK